MSVYDNLKKIEERTRNWGEDSMEARIVEIGALARETLKDLDEGAQVTIRVTPGLIHALVAHNMRGAVDVSRALDMEFKAAREALDREILKKVSMAVDSHDDVKPRNLNNTADVIPLTVGLLGPHYERR